MPSTEKLKKDIAATESELASVQARRDLAFSKLKDKDYRATTKGHIKLLHDYNEIRDIGQRKKDLYRRKRDSFLLTIEIRIAWKDCHRGTKTTNRNHGAIWHWR